MSNPRFIMLGGFLGAGKTTTIARLARHFGQQGKKVAIVTNDQATDLVDTNLLRSQGFDVGEVAGSCFCCNFNELTRTVECLSADQRPDVVIAEPVGSCTDLVATVIRPLQQIYSEPFDIAPYGVIIKPSHGLKILRRTGRGGFSPQAEYIFLKQLEEADFIVLNRIDELSAETIDELDRLIGSQFPDVTMIKMSAVTGQGFDQLLTALDQTGAIGTRVMDVDYDVYAEGEAELGWLNAQVTVESSKPFGLDALLLDLLTRSQAMLESSSSEVAHLKVIGMSEGVYGVANLVASADEPKMSIQSQSRLQKADIVVNARVAIDPELLTQIMQAVLAEACRDIGAEHQIHTLQSFRPGRPVPTHRL